MTEKERSAVAELIVQAFAEDIGDGDHTSLATIPLDAIGKVELIAKDTGVVAGVEVAAMVFIELDEELKVDIFIKDGSSIVPGDRVMTVEVVPDRYYRLREQP